MKIVHDEEHHQFRIEEKAYQAVLLYARGQNFLDFYHIYVPEPYRGKGAAAALLKFAFYYASNQGLKVVATCPFIAHDFLGRFPEYLPWVQDGSFVIEN